MEGMDLEEEYDQEWIWAQREADTKFVRWFFLFFEILNLGLTESFKAL